MMYILDCAWQLAAGILIVVLLVRVGKLERRCRHLKHDVAGLWKRVPEDEP